MEPRKIKPVPQVVVEPEDVSAGAPNAEVGPFGSIPHVNGTELKNGLTPGMQDVVLACFLSDPEAFESHADRLPRFLNRGPHRDCATACNKLRAILGPGVPVALESVVQEVRST